MRILVWPADHDGGSGWYRLRFPALALAAQGADVWVDFAGPRVLWDRDWSGQPQPPLDAQVMGLDEKPDADVVVLQRPGRAHWAELIPHLQAAGVRVVVDVDDDFAAIPAANIASREYDPRHSPRHNHLWLARACELADQVTVSTRALASRCAPHGRVTVLPNLVPAHYLHIRQDKLERTVGWSGSVDTHPGDLQTVGSAVGDVLAERPDWSVHVVGTGRGVARRLGIDPAQLTSTGRWLPFGAYAQALARFEVGIVPLQRSRFNEAKSALKLAEMSAVGVPVVASPTSDNRRLQAHGVGLLAASPSEWRTHLRRLTGDADYRAEMAARGREAMAAHTYEQWADLWLDAWERAADRERVSA